MRSVESGRSIALALISSLLAGIGFATPVTLGPPHSPPQFAAAGGKLARNAEVGWTQQRPEIVASPASADIKPAVIDAPGDAMEVALTFDDLPAHGPLPPGVSRIDIAISIIHALQSAHSPPVYGFVNGKRLEEDPSTAQVLRLWRDAGFPLDNHTFSHMDLNANSLETFEKDLLANESTLRTFMPDGDWHWLRFPFLREGDTIEKHRAITAFLRERG
jgi:hypothetical protein